MQQLLGNELLPQYLKVPAFHIILGTGLRWGWRVIRVFGSHY
jgi:hypothetical protein